MRAVGTPPVLTLRGRAKTEHRVMQFLCKNKTEIIRKVLAFRPCPNFDPDEPEFLEPADVVMPMPVLK